MVSVESKILSTNKDASTSLSTFISFVFLPLLFFLSSKSRKQKHSPLVPDFSRNVLISPICYDGYRKDRTKRTFYGSGEIVKSEKD